MSNEQQQNKRWEDSCVLQKKKKNQNQKKLLPLNAEGVATQSLEPSSKSWLDYTFFIVCKQLCLLWQ